MHDADVPLIDPGFAGVTGAGIGFGARGRFVRSGARAMGRPAAARAIALHQPVRLPARL